MHARIHPQRQRLNDEVHARPPEALLAPCELVYLALIAGDAEQKLLWQRVCDLARAMGGEPPLADAKHYSADLGPFRIKWERHTEFARLKIIADTAPLERLPAGFLEDLPGELIVAARLSLLKGGPGIAAEAIALETFAGEAVIGAEITGGKGIAMTDFRIRPDGYTRFVVIDLGMTPRQAGRMVQRLLEIETYRMLALLALPIAQELSPVLAAHELDLSRVTRALADGRVDEPAMLRTLTQLGAAVDSRKDESHFRFSASRAYYDLVRQRIKELREDRLTGLQTFHEFMERRLAPAMSTSLSAASRLDALSERIGRATALLSTRVAVANEEQNHQILATMNRRAEMQLQLQQTVEGLSIAAITYYVVGLIGQVAKGAHEAGLHVAPEIVVAASVPPVLLLVAWVVARLRRHAAGKAD